MKQVCALNNGASFKLDSFCCPHHDCGVYAQQHWLDKAADFKSSIQCNICQHWHEKGQSLIPQDISISKCHSCEKYAIWYKEKMVYPQNNFILPIPHNDLPNHLRKYYNEAMTITGESPRSAFILIRFVLEKFLQETFSNKKNLASNIQNKKIDSKIKKVLAGIQTIGNKVAHYKLDIIFEDIEKKVENDLQLICKCLNHIVGELITKENEFVELEKSQNKYKISAKAEDKKSPHVK